jgi:hypothetical protein
MPITLRRQRWLLPTPVLSALILCGGVLRASAHDFPETQTVQVKPEARLPLMASAEAWPIAPVTTAKPVRDTSEVKRMARAAATAHAVPIDYFLRLINQESGFNQRAVSRAGAQGIAQFMPGTAAMRGLKDPFDPAEALPKSAAFLSELTRQFGNVGLAAAAYNCGSNCVANWLAGRGRMPLETRAYVLAITGRTVQDWAPAEVRLREASLGQGPLLRDTSRRANSYRPSNWELDLLQSLTSRASAPAAPARPMITLADNHRPRGTGRLRSPSRASLESALCATCFNQTTY